MIWDHPCPRGLVAPQEDYKFETAIAWDFYVFRLRKESVLRMYGQSTLTQQCRRF